MINLLLIDDDVALCELLTEYLTPEDFAVSAVHDGDSGVARASTGDFQVLVLDIMLPGRDGLAVLRTLRQRGVETPVLMLTARGEDVDRIVGLELGADDYLPKPCNPRELVARLKAILRRSRPEVGDGLISLGDLQLRPGDRRLRRGGETLALTGAEFEVLRVLLRAAGEVIDKDTLCQQALGRPLGRYDRSLDVHISSLRRKLGPHPDGSPRIQAVRGRGYLYTRCDG